MITNYFGYCCSIGEADKPGPPPLHVAGTSYSSVNQHGNFDDPEGPSGDDHFFDDERMYAPHAEQYDLPPMDSDLDQLAAPCDDPPALVTDGSAMIGEPLQLASDANSSTALFLPARKFAGARHGYVFKLGVSGLGYYHDVPFVAVSPTIQCPSHAPRILRALPLSLDTLVLVDNAPDSHAPPCVPPCVVPALASVVRRLPRLHPPRGKRRRPSDGSFHIPRECLLADTDHRTGGLWAIDTVNANAWDGTFEHLGATSADIVVAQETRRRGTQLVDAERQAANAKWSLSLAESAITDASRNSAGVGVAARSHIGVARGPPSSGDPRLAARYHRRWIGAICKGGLHCGSTYPTVNEGMSAVNCDLLQGIAEDVAALRGPWLIGGDWNMSLETLVASGWPHFVNAIVFAPPTPSCHGNVNDFFVVSACFAHAVEGVTVVGDRNYVPHSPVRLFLRSAPRAILVRRLVAPARLGPSLPAGCLPRDAHDGVVAPSFIPPCRSARHNNRDSRRAARRESTSLPYSSPDVPHLTATATSHSTALEPFSQWLCDAERDLCNIWAMGDRATQLHSGRADGPRFIWAPALGNTACPQPHTSSVARNWRSVAAWCSDLRRVAVALGDGQLLGAGVVRAVTASRRRLARFAASWFKVGGVTPLDAFRNGATPDPRAGPIAAAAIAITHQDDPALLQHIEAAAVAAATAEERSVSAARRAD